jgi:hypothetical protein
MLLGCLNYEGHVPTIGDMHMAFWLELYTKEILGKCMSEWAENRVRSGTLDSNGSAKGQKVGSREYNDELSRSIKARNLFVK